MVSAIKRTLIRLSGNIYNFNPIVWYPLLIEGIAIEFNRWKEYKDIVFNSIIPNDNMDEGSIEDHNEKYDIPQNLGGTVQQKIDRVKEKANIYGYPGKDFLQQQLQLAGFELYVHESEILTTNLRRLNTFQLSPLNNIGLTSRYINPAITDGVLVVGSPICGTGRLILSRLNTFQIGPQTQIGTPDPNALDPQPCQYRISSDLSTWYLYFWLSPFPDRLAVDSSEFLEVATQQQFDYLQSLIIGLKSSLRNRCILQAKVV